MIHLDLDDLLHIATRTLGEFDVRDAGLLEAALARPRSTAFGEEIYPSIDAKAAALLTRSLETRRSSTATSGWRSRPPSPSTASTGSG